MTPGLDQVLYDFQLRAFGEELTRVNQLPVEERRIYVRQLWKNLVRRDRRATSDERVSTKSDHTDCFVRRE